jgi:hypothetical protein
MGILGIGLLWREFLPRQSSRCTPERNIIQLTRYLSKCISPERLELLVLAALSFVPLLWFHEPGTHINGNDTSFPLDPIIWFLGRLSMWRSQENGGDDWTIAAAGTFFHAIQAVFAIVGLPYRFAQAGSLIVWQALLLGSAYVLGRSILPGREAWPCRILLAVFYSFNTYMMSGAVWQNISAANLSGAVALPLILSFLMRANTNKKTITLRTFVEASFIGVLSAAMGMGPPVLMAILFSILLYIIYAIIISLRTSEQNIRIETSLSLFRHFSILVICGLLVNMFWLIPSSLFLAEQIHALSLGGLRAIHLSDWLSGVSAHTSLLNVFRGLGAWDWYSEYAGYPYAPFASVYLAEPFHILCSFVPPLLLISGILFRVRDWLYWGVLALLSLVFAAGAHPPTGAAFLWAVQHIPLFSMFRSPWYKFGIPLTLSTAVIAALATHHFITRLMYKLRQYKIVPYQFIYLFPLLIAGLQLWYSSPQLTGGMFVPDRKSVPGFIVRVPFYVFEMANFLSNHASDGRLFTLPRAKSEVYDWGSRSYGSILPLLNLIVATSVIHPPYDGVARYPFDLLINEIYDLIYNGASFEEQMASSCLLARTGARYILLRGDASLAFSDQRYSPKEIRQILLLHPHLSPVFRSGLWELYELDESFYLPRVSIATAIKPGSSVRELLGHIRAYSADSPSAGALCTNVVLAALPIQDSMYYPGATINFKMVNPARYIVHIVPSEPGLVGPLIFRENFSPLWKAYILPGKSREPDMIALFFAKKLPEERHFLVDGYANGWLLPQIPAEGITVVLEYQPQRLYFVGWLITIMGLFILYILVRKNKDDE